MSFDLSGGPSVVARRAPGARALGKENLQPWPYHGSTMSHQTTVVLLWPYHDILWFLKTLLNSTIVLFNQATNSKTKNVYSDYQRSTTTKDSVWPQCLPEGKAVWKQTYDRRWPWWAMLGQTTPTTSTLTTTTMYYYYYYYYYFYFYFDYSNFDFSTTTTIFSTTSPRKKKVRPRPAYRYDKNGFAFFLLQILK